MTQELVTVTIDGKQVKVPKGTNAIEAAKVAGIEIPHYCYHPNLSVVGNCRMCQIQVKGQPKLTIGCNTPVAEGMEISTQRTSKDVADAQAATLEFILINHPLDCTVCDQAGHCKLQDYHYTYNARSSRFLEDKVTKVKAEPLGPTVMLDGERCIMCTRCIRFCDEVTKTSEIGMLNRGDRSVIAVSPGRELANPLSGTVVDLCPVGALTHKKWRFNTRIWFTKQTESICPGCSTGCNVRVYERDGEIVQVKARVNQEVNKEWLCDEGRYGFDRFLPKARLTVPYGAPEAGGPHAPISWEDGLGITRRSLKAGLVLVAPDLLTEEYLVIKKVLQRFYLGARPVIAYRERALTDVEKILISPDYAANLRGAEFSGLVVGDPAAHYNDALDRIRRGEIDSVVLVGDRAIDPRDLDETLLTALSKVRSTIGILTDAEGALASVCKTILPGRSILEKTGMLVNRAGRLQWSNQVVNFPEGTHPEWRIFMLLADQGLAQVFDNKPVPQSERELSRFLLAADPRLKGISIARIRQGGIDLKAHAQALGDEGKESRAEKSASESASSPVA